MGYKKQITLWLFFVCTLVFLMVIVGGVTRLTNSGLSMVEWKPLLGWIPPLNTEQWQEVFDKYKQFPEYKIINKNMQLDDFKFIFYWEYGHRILGRLIGLAYFLPLMYFTFKKGLQLNLKLKLWFGLVLGSLQGLMGWYMVKSGLIDVPYVSHYRLAAHLLLAILIAGYLWLIILDLNKEKDEGGRVYNSSPAWTGSLAITGILTLQIIWGAFTAGKKAGYGFNTFPTMNGSWIPPGIFSFTPRWQVIFESNVGIQFTHRLLAFVLLTAVVSFWLIFRSKPLSIWQKRSIDLLMVSIAIQFGLGVATLLYVIPLHLAVIHQGGAFIVFLAALSVNHSFKTSNMA